MSEGRDHAGRLTRRRALKEIAGTAGAALAFPVLNHAGQAHPMPSGAALRAGAGPAPYTPGFFQADQLEAIASLAEMIIPADDHSPGAGAARVHEFIDTMVAESSEARKESWVDGLAAIDQLASREYEKKFLECGPNQKEELLRAISANEGHPATKEEHFFAALKNATIQGYYTSPIGIHQELEYQGNTALGEFEGCAHMPHKMENK